MSPIAVLVFSLLHGLAASGGMDSAHARGSLLCTSQAPGGDTRDIECPLDASETAQRFSFKANFAGGHDDTTASMSVTLNGLPLACEHGSKTSLSGEDGDVSLECKFSVVEKAGPKLVLKATLSWRHAQFTNVELYSY